METGSSERMVLVESSNGLLTPDCVAVKPQYNSHSTLSQYYKIKKPAMSQHRTWDENRSPQWKYLFQKESANRRKTRKDLEKEYREKRDEENEEYSKLTKFGKVNPSTRKNKVRKVSKEQLREKLEATNNKIKKLLNANKDI